MPTPPVVQIRTWSAFQMNAQLRVTWVNLCKKQKLKLPWSSVNNKYLHLHPYLRSCASRASTGNSCSCLEPWAQTPVPPGALRASDGCWAHSKWRTGWGHKSPPGSSVPLQASSFSTQAEKGKQIRRGRAGENGEVCVTLALQGSAAGPAKTQARASRVFVSLTEQVHPDSGLVSPLKLLLTRARLCASLKVSPVGLHGRLAEVSL